MQKFLLVSVLLSTLMLASCTKTTPTPPPTNTGATAMNIEKTGSGEDTTVCPEGQIMADTVCVPYSGNGNNASLFGMDFSTTINKEIINSGSLQGYYVEPKSPGNYPGIVMIHEWWGLNENIKYMAQLLANSGYRVFAIDLYGGEVATTPDRARELATSVRSNPTEADAKMKLATEYLRNTKSATKLGTLGWCFGGQQSLNVSLETPIDATVIYYGNLTEDTTKIANLAGPVLGIFGDRDTSIPLEKIQLFQKNLKDLGKENTFYIYPGLGHAFANPSGANYASGQTIDAWDKTLKFLEENLKK